jgi:hypothetical protein
MTMQLGSIVANPASMPDTAWAVPHKVGVPIQRLAPPPGTAQARSATTRQQLYQPVLHRELAAPRDVFSEDFSPDEPTGSAPPSE